MREKLLRIKSTTQELARLRAEISLFIENGLDEITRNRVILSVDEAAANTITHGYTDSTGTIECQMQDDGQFFSFILTDDALPFNPLTVEKADVKKIHAEGKNHGLGVDVYRRVMNTHYERTQSGKNCLTLRIAKHHEENV